MNTIHIHHIHSWTLSIAQAREIQISLAQKVIHQDTGIRSIRYVAGVDVGFESNGTVTRAAVCVLDFPSLQLIEYRVAYQATCFPYVPGYLSFREIPAVIDAFEKLQVRPDLILCDGQGIAHPRRLGIASHLGVLLDMPTIGVAKSRLIGTHTDLADNKGSWVPLMDGNELIGCVLRTRQNVQPLFISIGHRVSLDTAIKYTLACTTKYRLPETTRWAHRLASQSVKTY